MLVLSAEPPVLLHVVLRGVVHPLLLVTVSNKLSFQWQSSPDFLVSPSLNKNKTHILEQVGVIGLLQRPEQLATEVDAKCDFIPQSLISVPLLSPHICFFIRKMGTELLTKQGSDRNSVPTFHLLLRF